MSSAGTGPEGRSFRSSTSLARADPGPGSGLELAEYRGLGPGHLAQDVGMRRGPDERLWVGIVFGEVVVDDRLQLLHAPEYTTSDAVLRDIAE